MRREALLVRFLRALAGKSQERLAKELGVHPSLIGHFERGRALPSREHLERLAAGAGITLADAEEILRLYEALRQSRRRKGRDLEDLLDGLAQGVRARVEAALERILTRPSTILPHPDDRKQADELWALLEGLSVDSRLAVVRVSEKFQHWALCEKICAESAKEALRDVERAAGLVRLAQAIADRVPGPERWRHRVQAYATAHAANVLRIAGDLNAAATGFESARIL